MMNRMKMTAMAAVAVFGMTAVPVLGSNLEITVGTIRSDSGKVLAALHTEAGAEMFPDPQGAVWAQWVKATPGEQRFVFAGLPAGRFAVAVFHDENDNGELDTNLLGLPKEGYGFSRNATGSFGPARFADAAVEVLAGSDTVHTATELIYRRAAR
jgi:uncharacterized protein (DUF2141 family)